VIDMEVVRGAERMLVNCQLRGLDPIGVEPLGEMHLVAQRSEAGVAIVSSATAAGKSASGVAQICTMGAMIPRSRNARASLTSMTHKRWAPASNAARAISTIPMR